MRCYRHSGIGAQPRARQRCGLKDHDASKARRFFSSWFFARQVERDPANLVSFWEEPGHTVHQRALGAWLFFFLELPLIFPTVVFASKYFALLVPLRPGGPRHHRAAAEPKGCGSVAESLHSKHEALEFLCQPCGSRRGKRYTQN